jgi:hypothetical protein
MDQPDATITITRKAKDDVRVRQIYISLDGKTVAELLYGDVATLRVPPGRHRLRANNTLVWKTLDIELRAGEQAAFEVVNRPGFGSFALLSLLGAGPIYLRFERTSD